MADAQVIPLRAEDRDEIPRPDPGEAGWEDAVLDVLAFARRRLLGDYQVDEFGFDQELTDEVFLRLVRPFYEKWFRVETSGVHNVPSDSGAPAYMSTLALVMSPTSDFQLGNGRKQMQPVMKAAISPTHGTARSLVHSKTDGT